MYRVDNDSSSLQEQLLLHIQRKFASRRRVLTGVFKDSICSFLQETGFFLKMKAYDVIHYVL